MVCPMWVGWWEGFGGVLFGLTGVAALRYIWPLPVSLTGIAAYAFNTAYCLLEWEALFFWFSSLKMRREMPQVMPLSGVMAAVVDTGYFIGATLLGFHIHQVNALLPMAVVSLMFSMCGFVLSASGIATLGNRFSMLPWVQKRETTRWPYSMAKHPIYTGYGMLNLGLLVLYPSMAFAVLFVGWFAMTVWRAVIEDRRLMEV